MEIIVYSKPNCGACDLTKQLLLNNGVPYIAIDATKDSEAMDVIVERGFLGFPVVNVNNWERSWSGYNHDGINQLIDEVRANESDN